MDLIIVADSHERSQPLLKAAAKAGYRIARLIGPDDAIAKCPKAANVDAVIVICDQLTNSQLAAMRAIVQAKSMPVMVLSNDGSDESIETAIKAGASSYVIEYGDLSRIGSLLQVAIINFQEKHLLATELESMRTALVQRKIIEKAKGIIMKQRNIDEDDAYKAIRQLAMNHNKKIGEVAGQIVTAAEVLL